VSERGFVVVVDEPGFDMKEKFRLFRTRTGVWYVTLWLRVSRIVAYGIDCECVGSGEVVFEQSWTPIPPKCHCSWRVIWCPGELSQPDAVIEVGRLRVSGRFCWLFVVRGRRRLLPRDG